MGVCGGLCWFMGVFFGFWWFAVFLYYFVASKLYGVNVTIIIFVFVFYCFCGGFWKVGIAVSRLWWFKVVCGGPLVG